MISFRKITLATLLLGCASAGPPTSEPTSSSGDRTTPTDQPWSIKTREHIDLWLHGFAMLQDDTTQVPLFERGYRDRLIVARNAANVRTLLDTNRDRLRARFALNNQLTNAQFIALSVGSMSDLRQLIGIFLRTQGNPRGAPNAEVAALIAGMARTFPSPADHEWLRMFWEALSDESSKFYHNYWLTEQRNRAATLAAVDSLWQRVHRPALQRFLDNTQQANGNVILSLVLNGEGRTVPVAKDLTITAVTFPDRPADALEAIFVIVHEVVAAVTSDVVTDNVTPAEQRSAEFARYISSAAVRGGAMLLQRVSPAIADDYARYYLRAINRQPGANPLTTLASAFPLPDAIRTAIDRQLAVVLGGI